MEELKPDQALNMLVAAARQARLTYEEHAALEQAVRVLVPLVPQTTAADSPDPPGEAEAEPKKATVKAK